MKLAYISKDDPLDIMSFSGISAFMAKSLEKQDISIDYVGPLEEDYSLPAKLKAKFYGHLFKKRYLPWAEPAALQKLALQVSKNLSALEPDVIFSLGTMQIA